MNSQQATLFAVIFALSVAIGYLLSKRWVPPGKSNLSPPEVEEAKHVIAAFDKSKAYDLTDDEFESIKGRVLIAGVPAMSKGIKEDYEYYYDWPDWKYDVLGEPSPLPEGLFSRFYPIYSSFNTSGYSWSVRDGVHSQLRSPFGKWTTNNGKYYYVASY